MHAALMTMILVTGAGPYSGYNEGTISQVSHYDEGCSTCGNTGGNCVCFSPKRWCEVQHERLMAYGSMPQTCYSPRYGCYPGNGRDINRYPAFHGTFYRRPYNYRNVFDYPWHAELHEPTSMFSYNVPPQNSGGVPRGEALPLPISSRRTATRAATAPNRSNYQASENLRAIQVAQPELRSVIQSRR